MRLGIGVITRNRFNYTKNCINSILKHNQILNDCEIIIGDDASEPDVVKKTRSEFLRAHFLHFRKQRGMSANIKQVFDFAEAYLDLDYLLFTVNDVKCIRNIDIKSLIQFMDNYQKAGQIQFVHFKGKLGDKKRERALFNWTTRKPIEIYNTIKVGKETLHQANWSYCNLPSITRLHAVDITRGTIERERKKGESLDKYIQNIELRWVKNWYNGGLENYEIEPNEQPFIGLDVDITERTEGIKA